MLRFSFSALCQYENTFLSTCFRCFIGSSSSQECNNEWHKEVGVGMVASEKRDSLEILPYFYVQEKDVAWSSRFYQLNWFKDHESLVSVEILQAAFSQLLQDKSITKYRSMDFRDTFSFPAENLKDYTFIGFLTKTDAFFDAVRQLGEMRTIGIQPLALNSVGDTVLLPVMYYPQVRKNLSSFTIKSYDYVQHVDDLFYFSLFDGPIYPFFSKENKVRTAYLSRFENENCFSHKEMSFIKTELEEYIRYFNGVAH